MLKEFANELKSYNFLQKFKKDYYVDARDQRQWKVAKIVSSRSLGARTYITIRYDGHPNQWNDEIELPPPSQKLAPFRRFSLPYTGANNQIMRDLGVINWDYHIKNMNKLDNPTTIKPEFINQYYRGELFILVDYVLTTRTIFNEEELPTIFILLKSYINTGFKFLTQALENIQQVYQLLSQVISQALSEPMLIYVSHKIACLFACIQFLFIFNSLAAKNQKRIRFFENDKYKNPEVQALRSMVLSKQVYAVCEKMMNFRSKDGKGYPWNIKKEVFIFLQNFQKVQFPSITSNKEINDALEYLPYLHKKFAITAQYLDSKQLQSLMASFSRRKNGLNELKFILQRAGRGRVPLITQEMKKTKLIEHLVNNQNFNSELFKRSVSVFEFWVKQGLLTSDHLKQIIELSKDKHELELKNFYNSLSEFARFLDDKTVVSFFNDITQLPIDENMISLVKDYTLSVTNLHPHFKSIMMNEIGFGVTYFFRIIDQNHLNSNQILRNKVIESLAALLVSPYYSSQVSHFVSQSFKSIKNKKNIDSHLKIIYEAMKICQGQRMNNAIELIQREMSIIDCVVKAVTEDNTISQKALENMFQFLEQVNHVARKPINANHIKNFWMRKECRKYLLKFLRKHKPIRTEQKSQEKIISKQLDCQTIKEISLSIFSNPEMMENFRIDLETYQTIDQLLISYNHRQDIIDYNYKHTLRLKKIDSLFGMHIYKQIITNVQDIKIATKACERLIQYYLRPVPRAILSSELTVKLNSWKQLTSILDQLDIFILKAYKILLISIEGRMKSLNITQPTPLTLGVQLNDIVKQITLPRYSSLWKLRKTIGEQFNIQNTNFEMSFVQNNSKLTFQRQQDLSVAAIPISKQSVISIIVTPSKQMHPHNTAIQQFKAYFSQSKAETLFQLMVVEPPHIHPQILDILSQIPFIRSLQKNLSKLDLNHVQWNDILDSAYKSKLKYQLKIINTLSLNKNTKWLTTFIQKKGVQHLSKMLIQRKHSDDHEVLSQIMLFLWDTIKVYRKVSQNLPFSQAFIKDILQAPQKPIHFSEYYFNTFGFILQLTNFPTISMSSIFKLPQIQSIIEIALLSKYMPEFPTMIYDLSIKTNSLSSLFDVLNTFLKFSYLKNHYENCRGFFDLLIILIDKTDCKGLMRNLIECVQAIQKQRLVQNSGEQTNWLIEGYLRLLRSFDRKSNFEQIFNQSREKIYNELITQGLFISAKQDYRYKSNAVRRLTYNLIGECKQGKVLVDKIGDIMLPIMRKGTWRKQYEWNVRATQINKKKLTGIKNLSATCYINSLFQQLYFIQNFRSRILELNTSQITDRQNIAYEVQKIFAFLKYSEGPYYTTTSLCRNFIMDGNPINPRVQTDVDEFFHSLMDKLQRNLKELKEEALIKDIFGGQYANLIIGQECQHKSERIQHFLSMRLEIKNKNSLEAALQEFIKAEVLQGDNAYFCERCNTKVRAQRRVCIKTLPDILILTLKRFQFDYQTMQKFKLNTFCSFPDQIDMLPYTRQNLYQEDTTQPQPNLIYKLKGVIIHYGISQAGHYTSYINTTQGWNYFDDENVQPFDIANLENECFGGIESNPFGDDEQKRKNAYLLFYERVNVMEQVKETKINALIAKEVEEDNWKQKYIRILFDEGLQNFMLKFGSSNPKLLLQYFHLVVLRGLNKSSLGDIWKKCEEILVSSKEISKWYLQQMDEFVIEEFVVFGDRIARYLVGWLITCSLKNYSDVQFYKRCFKLFSRKNVLILAKIIKYACSIHPECLKLLGEQSLGERVMKLIQDPNYTFSAAYTDKIKGFGRPLGEFLERKDNSEVISLLEAIEGLKVNISLDDVDLLVQKCKKSDASKSLAKLIARKYKDMEGFTKLYNYFFIPKILKFQPKIGEEYIYEFSLCLLKQIVEITDESTPKKHDALVELYMHAIKESLQGYMNMKILLAWLFKISFSNSAFRDKIAQSFNNNKENKKMIKLIKEWIKQSPKAAFSIKSGKLGYWKIPRQYGNGFFPDTDEKIKVDEWLSTLNSLIQKHNINYDEGKVSIDVGSVVLVDPLPQVRNFTKVKGKVQARLGWLIQVQTEDGNIRLFTEDQIIVSD